MIKYQLPKTVEIILRLVVGPKISSSKIKFIKFGEIEIQNVKIEKKGEKIVEAPKVLIEYDKESLKKLRLKRIKVFSPKVYLIKKNNNINIIEAFSSGEKSNKKAGVSVPIDEIVIKNSFLNFKDITYSREINKNIYDVNGYINFNKIDGIDLKFSGNNKNEGYIFEYNNRVENMDMLIQLSNISVDNTLIQYGFDDKEITYADGIFNMSLNIKDKGLFGSAKLEKANVVYDSFKEKVENVKGNIEFKGKEITVDLDFKVKKYPGKLSVYYSDLEGVKVNFLFDKLPYEIAAKYRMLEELKLPFQGMTLKNIDIALKYKKKIGFSAVINYFAEDYKKIGFKFKNINGAVEFKNNKLRIYGENLKIKSEIVEYEKEFSYLLNLDLSEKEKLKFEFFSNLLDISGVYNKNKKKIELFQNGKPAMLFNLKNNQIKLLNIKTKELLADYKLAAIVREDKNRLILDNFGLVDENDNGILKVNGVYDRDNRRYYLKLMANNLTEKEILKNYNVGIKMDFKGEIVGENEKFILKSKISQLEVKNGNVLIKTKGDLKLSKNQDFDGKFIGEILSLGYKNIQINGVKVDIKYNKNLLTLKNIENQHLKLDGVIDLKDEKIDLDYLLKDYSNFLVKDKIKLNLNSIIGKVTGTFKNIRNLTELKDVNLEMINGEKIKAKGNIKLDNGRVFSETLFVNNSKIDFDYNIKNKKGNFKLNILEENLGRYYNYTDLKYRLLSEIKGKIDDEKILADVFLKTDLTTIKGIKIPNIIAKGTYKKDNKENFMDIKSLNLENINKETILRSFGKIDIKNKKIDYKIDNQRVELKRLIETTKNSDLLGEFNIYGEIKGKLESPKYSFVLDKGSVNYNKISLKDINIKIDGDLERIKLQKLYSNFKGNIIKGDGSYNIKNKKYNFDIFARDIDLKFLNEVVPEKYVKNVSGIGDLIIKFSEDENKKIASLSLKNTKFESPITLLNAKNLNMKLKIDKEKLEIEELIGELNNGKIKGQGYLKIPPLDEIKINEEFYKDLDYSFNLILDDIVYKMQNYFSINLSSNLIYSENKVKGNIIINNGEITGIVKENQGLILKLLKILLTKLVKIINNSGTISDELDIESQIVQTPDMDLSLMIKEGVNLNVEDISGVAQDIKGKITGRFDILGKDDKITIVGESEIEKGSFSLGTEDFTVNRAIILSDKRSGKISDFKPNIIFDISSMTDDGRVEINVQGPLDNLNLRVTTNKGTHSSSLRNMLNSEDGKDKQEALGIIFKTLIDSQISNTLLSPLTKTVKRIFNISKFRIVSDIFNQKAFSNENGEREENPDMFNFGAYLEAENPIYKDKYFWVLRLGLIDGNRYNMQNTTKTTQQESYSNSINEIDFKVERRYKSGWSYGVGVSKLNNDTVMEEDEKRNLNYYVDFKFEKKYNSIEDIFNIKK